LSFKLRKWQDNGEEIFLKWNHCRDSIFILKLKMNLYLQENGANNFKSEAVFLRLAQIYFGQMVTVFNGDKK
jgi:hypothetical protein